MLTYPQPAIWYILFWRPDTAAAPERVLVIQNRV